MRYGRGKREDIKVGREASEVREGNRESVGNTRGLLISYTTSLVMLK